MYQDMRMNKMLLTIEKKYLENRNISISIMSPFIILILQFFILYYFNIINTRTGEIVQLICKISTVLCFLYSLSSVLKRKSSLVILIYIIFTVILLLNYLFFEKNRIYLLSILVNFLLLCLPCFVYSFSIDDREMFRFITEKASFIIYIIGIFTGLLVFTNRISLGSYNMSISYYLLLPTIIYLNYFFEKVSCKYAVLVIISVIIMIGIGSRGAIPTIVVYLVLYQLINLKRMNRKRFLLNVIILLSLVFGIVYFDNIVILLLNFFNVFGISSRSLLLFVNDPTYLSGRDVIYKEILYQLSMHPISGIGIAGDRAFTGGLYSHNIILEIMSGFGVIIGTGILILLFYVILKSLFSKDTKGSNIMLVWFTVGVVPLIFSGSYLQSYEFWIFLGLSIRFIIDLKINPQLSRLRNSNYMKKSCNKNPQLNNKCNNVIGNLL